MNTKIATIAAFMLLAGYSAAATITVNRSGSGDFATIQPALNVAADGDTILIGPGEYTERMDVWTPGGWTANTCAWVSSNALTIIGAGAGATFIGPISYAGNDEGESPSAILCESQTADLRIADLTIRNCNTGVNIWGSLGIERCNFYNNKEAVVWFTVGTGGGIISETDFQSIDPDFPVAIAAYEHPSDQILVEDCEFTNALPRIGGGSVVFRGCSFAGPLRTAIQIDGSNSCEIWSCDMSNLSVGVLALGASTRCAIHNSRIAGSASALVIGQQASVYVEGSALIGGINAVVMAQNADEIAIHGCDLLRGAGPVIVCDRASEFGAVTYDVTNNYWGTADEASIQSWIVDSDDDPSIFATVAYAPFAGQSVPAESATWGEVKAMFR